MEDHLQRKLDNRPVLATIYAVTVLITLLALIVFIAGGDFIGILDTMY